MPFTPTHILAVLPLRRWPALPFAALVIGSTVPDLCLYLPFRVERLYHHAHSFRGLFTVNLAVGLLIYMLWRRLLHAPMKDLLPGSLRFRVAPPTPARGTPRAGAAVVAALILGAATHVLWDTFTHRHRWGVDTFPAVFYAGVPLPGLPEISVYKLIQHGSSVVGLPLLVLWIALAWRRTPAHADTGPHTTIRPAARGAVWIGLVGLCAAATISVLAVDDATLSWRLHHVATRSGTAVASGLLTYGVAWHLRRWQTARQARAGLKQAPTSSTR